MSTIINQTINHFPVEEVKLSYSPKFKINERITISNSKDIVQLVRESWEDIEYYESAKVLLMNKSNRILGIKTISKGGISGTVVDPKIVFQTALLTNSTAIVLLHNHPSGNLTPSSQDKFITKQIKEGSKLLDIILYDHIIITREEYYSFADEGLL